HRTVWVVVERELDVVGGSALWAGAVAVKSSAIRVSRQRCSSNLGRRLAAEIPARAVVWDHRPQEGQPKPHVRVMEYWVAGGDSTKYRDRKYTSNTQAEGDSPASSGDQT